MSILSLDWVDLAGAFKAACGAEPPAAKVISASLDHLVHNGWSMDYQGLPPVDLHLAVEPDIAVAALLPLLKPRAPGWAGRQPTPPPELPAVAGEKIPPLMLAAALREALGSRPTCLIRSPLAWAGNTWDVAHPLDALGGDGGGGIGGGPGMAVGAALGLRDSAMAAAGSRPPAGRGARRRRLPDGLHGAVDRGALPHPAARRRVEQQFVLQ